MNPLNDGVDHINIYTKGATQLGRDLTNLSNIGFTHPTHGKFLSMEGFWYWWLTGAQFDDFKVYSGWKAKQEGKKLKEFRVDKNGLTEEDKDILKEAMKCKLRQNKNLLKVFLESDLPFKHYYYYGDKKANIMLRWETDALLNSFQYTRLQKVIEEGGKYAFIHNETEIDMDYFFPEDEG